MASKAKLETPKKQTPKRDPAKATHNPEKEKEKGKPRKRTPYVGPRPQKLVARKGQVEGNEPEVSRGPSNTGS